MKTFHFRLQRMRDLRHAREKDKLIEFGREQSKLFEEKEKLDLFQHESELHLQEMRAGRSQTFTVWEQASGQRYARRIAFVIDFQVGRVAVQEQSVERARLRYLDAHRDTAIMDKLREKKMIEWSHDVLKEEEKLLDETASRQHSDNRNHP